MAPKPDLSRLTVTLLLALFLFFSNATAQMMQPQSSSPFGFLEQLKGCRRGDKVKGINDLKKYLHKFGYLNYKKYLHHDDDDFDGFLEEAVKIYQLNFHLKPTGMLDDETVSQMMMPRCGFPDIINGTTSMRAAKINLQHRSIHTSIQYAFPPGKLVWPASKSHLTYGFMSTPSEATGAVTRALTTWAKNSHFTFSKASNYNSADLKISFHKGDHGDGKAFDGAGGVLAHAFYPTDGKFHLDAAEKWAIGPKPGAFDYESVALHEAGHLLGLAHSSMKGAAMAPSLAAGATVRGLHADDIAGIKALYKR